MSMKLIQRVLAGGLLALALGLTGCADDGGGNDSLLIKVTGGESNCESDDSVLDGAQCTVTVLVDDLAAIFAGTPVGDFLQCVDPLANELIEGPDSVLNTVLAALAEQNPDPADFQAAFEDLVDALASLGTNLPCALQALSGDNAAIAGCNAGACPGGGGGGIPLDPDQLAGLCALPEIGPALVEGLGGACP